MKKSLVIVLVILLVLAAVGGFGYMAVNRQLQSAALDQKYIREDYEALLMQADLWNVTVLENGTPMGIYTLADLGLRDTMTNAIESRFSEKDRLSSEAFAALPIRERLAWKREEHPAVESLTITSNTLNLQPVMNNLLLIKRTAPENAYLAFEDGAYHLAAEVPGTELDEENVRRLLHTRLGEVQIGKDKLSDQTVEITETDCYRQPEITLESGGFDYEAQLSEDLENVSMTVVFRENTDEIPMVMIRQMVSVNPDGTLEIQEDVLKEYVAQLAQQYDEPDTLFHLDSYVDGWIDIDFLPCSYALKQEELAESLRESLLNLQSTAVKAPFLCLNKKGEALDLGDTYIEIDMNNQHMTYYKDGKVLVHTDIVSGSAWKYWTPEGLYHTYDFRTNNRMVADDYDVTSDYWIRFFENYGIHDAKWRTQFGGTKYYFDGSHGCINTPLEAMKEIYENCEEGVPVILWGGYPVEDLWNQPRT